MKTIRNFIIILLLIFSVNINSQDKKLIDTISFKVSGICNLCKLRIENAAIIKGVKYASWDIKTQMLTVIYRNDKVNIIDIHKSIAITGHDTEKVRASDEAYKKLPKCCAYRDNKKHH